MSSRLSKIRSVHTYVMPRTVYFGWICMWLVNHYLVLWKVFRDITEGLFLLLFKNTFWTYYFRWIASTLWLSIHFQFPMRKKADLIKFTPYLEIRCLFDFPMKKNLEISMHANVIHFRIWITFKTTFHMISDSVASLQKGTFVASRQKSIKTTSIARVAKSG